MNPSADLSNHEWARKLAYSYVRQCPHYRDDIEAEAIYALVLAEQHPLCPGGEDYRRFACTFVKRGVNKLVKKIKRQSWSELIDAPARDSPTNGWLELRYAVARKLRPPQRKLFLTVYGEDEYLSLSKAAEVIGISLAQAKRLHGAALEAARGLSCLHSVA